MRRTDEWVAVVEDRAQLDVSGVRRLYEDRRGRKVVRWRGQWRLVTEVCGLAGLRYPFLHPKYLLGRPA